jgi:hypothetical protein
MDGLQVILVIILGAQANRNDGRIFIFQNTSDMMIILIAFAGQTKRVVNFVLFTSRAPSKIKIIETKKDCICLLLY